MALTSREVCEKFGITYRQLDYWIREGKIRAPDPTPGCGYRRSFTRQEIADIAHLVKQVNEREYRSLYLTPRWESE